MQQNLKLKQLNKSPSVTTQSSTFQSALVSLIKLCHAGLRKANSNKTPQAAEDAASLKAELFRTKSELKRVTEERDILKKAAKYSASQSE